MLLGVNILSGATGNEYTLSREIKLTPSEVAEINEILERSNKELYERLDKLRKEYEEL